MNYPPGYSDLSAFLPQDGYSVTHDESSPFFSAGLVNYEWDFGGGDTFAAEHDMHETLPDETLSPSFDALCSAEHDMHETLPDETLSPSFDALCSASVSCSAPSSEPNPLNSTFLHMHPAGTNETYSIDTVAATPTSASVVDMFALAGSNEEPRATLNSGQGLRHGASPPQSTPPIALSGHGVVDLGSSHRLDNAVTATGFVDHSSHGLERDVHQLTSLYTSPSLPQHSPPFDQLQQAASFQTPPLQLTLQYPPPPQAQNMQFPYGNAAWDFDEMNYAPQPDVHEQPALPDQVRASHIQHSCSHVHDVEWAHNYPSPLIPGHQARLNERVPNAPPLIGAIRSACEQHSDTVALRIAELLTSVWKCSACYTRIPVEDIASLRNFICDLGAKFKGSASKENTEHTTGHVNGILSDDVSAQEGVDHIPRGLAGIWNSGYQLEWSTVQQSPTLIPSGMMHHGDLADAYADDSIVQPQEFVMHNGERFYPPIPPVIIRGTSHDKKPSPEPSPRYVFSPPPRTRAPKPSCRRGILEGPSPASPPSTPVPSQGQALTSSRRLGRRARQLGSQHKDQHHDTYPRLNLAAPPSHVLPQSLERNINGSDFAHPAAQHIHDDLGYPVSESDVPASRKRASNVPHALRKRMKTNEATSVLHEKDNQTNSVYQSRPAASGAANPVAAVPNLGHPPSLGGSQRTGSLASTEGGLRERVVLPVSEASDLMHHRRGAPSRSVHQPNRSTPFIPSAYLTGPGVSGRPELFTHPRTAQEGENALTSHTQRSASGRAS
ncbi:hypothetical protein CONPUDRAFT_169635 [Coniophora puteana RWD-64-598 SS2]|uniref:Uncharacterized protein n=1 Tax=Coniophora puteana (strain RWD-64-598) TaxID=741705 RepID=A0A5M3M7P6_CONPW|nr:uncharacterized protein CONPUDRAFT_169635 [Coniophora puteana RWD-64-598 SS2]EIW75248.1 hypothetical protein CONPUDRAFT_169635 [Coniophora puteana RWD-64-598 SS2]